MLNPTSRVSSSEPLSRLLLDSDNPRFGGQQAGLTDQTMVLDYVVETYGIDDVISSLAVNGYFKAEPLVGRTAGDKIVIVEGNRRLAACLILAGDERAKNQGAKASHFSALWKKHGSKSIDPVPVITFDAAEGSSELISYLGVRHISASSPWDSYAKAHWAAEAVENTSLTVSDISTMIGDPHRTVARLLEGYYVVNQAVKAGYFVPRDCVRRGRGSVTEYPFSWVYTILGYSGARQFLAMPDDGPKPNPLSDEALPRIRTMLTAMFGSQSRGMNSAIRDSRALGDLASAFSDDEKVKLLEAGAALDEVMRVTRPVDERIKENLMEVRRLQSELTSALSETSLGQEVATESLSLAQGNRRAAANIEKMFREVLFPESLND